jgi:uncharacterized membrane protein
MEDEDDFAPNPFRSSISSNHNNNIGGLRTTNSGNLDFFETPISTTTNNDNYNHHHSRTMDYSQPDPNTGMVGSVPSSSSSSPYYPQPQPLPSSSPYLTGTMDQLGGNSSTSSAGSVTNNNNNNNNKSSNVLYSFLTSCCLPYETIQSLFDIDTIDIYIRIKASLLHFHQPNHFRLQILGTKRSTASHPNDTDGVHGSSMESDPHLHHHHKGPDLYGPIWISMTCMFILGITANINDYYRHIQKQQRHSNSHNSNQTIPENDTIEEEFEYDLTHLLNAMYICFMYTFGISTFFWLVCICMGFNNGKHSNDTSSSSSRYLSWIYWVCHYGYSLVPILIGTCVAWILPYSLYHWIVLSIATFASSLFIIRNLSTPLLEQEMITVTNDPTNGTFTDHTTTTTTNTQAKAAPILLSILGVHFTFLLVLKLTFYP